LIDNEIGPLRGLGGHLGLRLRFAVLNLNGRNSALGDAKMATS